MEYLGHTADIQLHTWGADLKEAFELAVICMFGYMTELETVEYKKEVHIEAQGHDLASLLYALLDEFLFSFNTQRVVCREVQIVALDLEKFTIRATGYGERFQMGKHPQGTEVKAITYSNMQILSDFKPNQDEQDISGASEPAHVFVIVDI